MKQLRTIWKQIYETLVQKDRVSLVVDNAPLGITLFRDGELVELSLMIGVQRLPEERIKVLFQEETGRAWLAYRESGEVMLVYQGKYQPNNIAWLQKRLYWFFRVSHWAKQTLLGDEVAAL